MSDNSSDKLAFTKFGRETSINFLGQLFGRVTSFTFILVITQVINPETYGTFTLALSVVTVTTSVFGFGLYRSIDYYVPKYFQEGDQESLRALISFVVRHLSISLVLGTLVLLLVRDDISNFVNSPELPVYLAIMSVAVIFNGFLDVLNTLFSAVGKMRYRVLISGAGHPLAKFILIIPAVWAGDVIFGLTMGYLASLALVFTIGVYVVRTRIDGFKKEIKSITESAGHSRKSILSYTTPLYLQELMYKVQNHASYFVLGFYLGPASIGVYQVGYQLISILALASGAMAPAFKPIVAGADSTQEIKSVYRTAARWLALITIPLVVIITAAPGSLIEVLFDPSYGDAVVVVIPLSAGVLANSITGPQDMLLEGQGHSNLLLMNSVISITIRLGLLVVLVPISGVLGAGIAVGTSMAIMPFLGVAEIYALERFHPFGRDILKFFCAGIGSYFAGRSVASLLSNNLTVLLLASMTAIITYIIFINALDGFTEEDMNIARAIDDQLGYRIVSWIIW